MSTGAIPPAGGVGGSDHQVQVNSGGVFAGIDNDSSGKVLTSNGAGSNPTFQTGATSGITQLTGDATAGPGTGSQAVTLASTAVTPGSYTAADITVDAKGRVTAAASGGSGGTVTHTGALTANQLLKGNAAADITVGNLTGDVTTSGSMATTLADTAVTPGSYTATNLTVDSKGRITAAANGSAGGGTVTTSGSPANGNLAKFTGATAISNADLTGDVTTSGTVATTLANTAVTPASYTNTNLTVDSKGRITAASNGSAGSSGALILLEQHTASASASLDFTSWYSSTYDEYQIELLNVLLATNTQTLLLRVSTNGGSSYVSTTTYAWDQYGWRAGGAGPDGGTGKSSISLHFGTTSSTANQGEVSGFFRLYEPGSASIYKRMLGQTRSWNTVTGTIVNTQISGEYQAATAVNAFQFLTTSGNITSGTIRVYGIAK